MVTGLELGADDYVTKPFSPRVPHRPRQGGPPAGGRRGTGRERRHPAPHNLVIHPGRREVLVDEEPAPLTFTEFGILTYLARRPGWVFTRSQIVDAVRGDDYPVTDRSVGRPDRGASPQSWGAPAGSSRRSGASGYRFKE